LALRARAPAAWRARDTCALGRASCWTSHAAEPCAVRALSSLSAEGCGGLRREMRFDVDPTAIARNPSSTAPATGVNSKTTRTCPRSPDCKYGRKRARAALFTAQDGPILGRTARTG